MTVNINANYIGSKESGAVLVSALLILLLLVAVLTSTSLLIVNRSSAVAIESDQVALNILTTSGLEIGVYNVMSTPEEQAVEGQTKITLNDSEVSIAWCGENARLNINSASQQSIAGLIKMLGSFSDEPDKIAQRILDRRGDTGQAKQSRPSTKMPLAHQRPFAHPAELLSIDGLSLELFRRLAPFITIYSGTDSIDPRIASETVLSNLPEMNSLSLQSLLSLHGRSKKESIAILENLGISNLNLDVQQSRSTRFTVTARLNSGMLRSTEIVAAIFPNDVEPYRILYYHSKN